MASDIELVRDSLKDIREDIRDIRESISKIYEKLDKTKKDTERELRNHVESCIALASYMKNPSLLPSKRVSWLSLLIKIGPIILAAGLGLLGLGAYWGSHNGDRKIENRIMRIEKLLKEHGDATDN